MKKIIILIIFILSAFSLSQAQLLSELEKVKEVKIIEHSREDVRKIFAGYKLETDPERHEDSFYTDNAEINISYSEGLCTDDESEGWNISEWKVDQISVSPKAKIKIQNATPFLTIFGITLSKLKKEKVWENDPDAYLYYYKDLSIALEVNKGEIENIYFEPPKKYLSLLCDKERARKLSATKSWFTDPLKKRRVIIDSNRVPDITNLILSLPEITIECSLSQQTKSCLDIKVIAVFAVGKDPENDILTFDFKVSGGKIIDKGEPPISLNMPNMFRSGYGKKVLWDLSGVKPGTYTITAATDDGCGFCGKSMTKTVVVKECPDCNKKF